MQQLKVVEFLEKNKEFLFPNKQYPDIEVENALLAVPDSFEMTMNSIPFRKPSTVKLIAFFPGSLGIDRFYLGDVKKGILKYFTFGGFGIWWIKDILSAKDRCREYNCKKLMDAVNDPAVVPKMIETDAKIHMAGQVAKTAIPVAIDMGRTTVKGFQDSMEVK